MDPSANDNQWALPDPAARPPATPTIPTPNLPADPAVDQWAAPNIAPLIRNNLATSFGSNADAEAVNRRAAIATGVPLVTARNLPDQVQMQAAQQSFDAQLLARKFPTTAQLLANPDNMRLTHDDIPATAAVEQHVQALGNPQPTGPTDANGTVYPANTQFLQPNPQPPSFRDRLTSWLRDLVGLPPAGADEGAQARAFLDVTAKQMGTDRQGLRDAIGGMSTVPTQFASGFMNSFTAGLAPDTQGEPDTTAGQVASGAGQLAGFLGGAPLKLAEGAVERLAGPVLERTAGESFVKGLSKDVTRQAATLGLATSLSSAGQALDQNTPAGAGEVALHAAESGAGMGATFGAAGRLFPDNTIAQTVARVLGTNVALDAMNGQRPWDDRPLAQKVFDYGLNTVFSLNGAGRTGGGWLYDAARADAATQDANVLGGLSQASTVSKLRERDPDLFKQFVANAAQDGPVPAVYVDGTTLAEALHQSGIGTDEMQTKMPDLQPQLEEALTTGGQVRIRIEDYATHIAGGPLDAALLPHLRTDPEGMTQTEAQAFYQSHADQLKGAADQITAQNAQDQPFIDSQKQVQDRVLSQLEATGRFRPEVNQAYAAMQRDFYTTMADRTGQLPHELFAQHPLNIDAESLGGFTQGEGTPRAAYNPDTRTISLLKDADLTSFLHESGHHFLDTMSQIATAPNAPDGIKADMATALKFMGHDGDAASFRALPLEGQRAGHEAFAQGFEKYLMEGKAPSFETRNLFSRFRSWLLNVYKSLGALKVEINPEIRGVFDRMMASDAAIKQAEQARQYMPMFDSPEKASMTPEQWQEYQALGAEASSKALDELSAKSIRDLAWSDNVRSAALRDLAKGAAEQRKAARREVEAQVDKQPVYAAQNFIRRGEIEPADRNNAKRKILEDASMSSTKLDLPALKAMYGDGPAAPWRYLRVGGEYGDVIKEGGIHPDLVADLFGFPSGDDLVRSLIAAEKRSDVVRGLTEQAMLEKHGEVATPEALAQAADDAVHNAIRTRFIATELKALNKALGPARELAKAAKDVAEATIAGKTIGSLSERQYTVAESRAGKEAMKRLAAGDVEGAAIAKRDQLLNNALARAARDAQAAVDKGLTYLKRFNKDSIRKNVDVDIRDQIDQLLERFDLRQNPPEGPTKAQQSLERWVESQQAAGYSPAIPADLLDPAVRQHYQDMPIERFNGLVDSVKALEHIGKSRRELMIGAEKHDLDEYVNTRLVPKMAERGERFTKDELLERPQDRHTNEVAIVLDHFRSWMRAAAAQLKPQEFKRNEYDRHELLGPFGESLTDPVMNANYEKNRMLRELSGDFQKAATELGRKWQDSLRDGVHNGMLPDPDKSTPGDVQPLRMTRGRMIGIALHVGNESNFGKLTKGWGWDPADVWRFLHENMTASDWKAVQTVWDLYDKHWPEMEAMNRRLGNTMPDRIEPRAFPTKFGEMRGGYAAIKYDALRSRRGEKDAAMEAINPAKGLFGRDYYRPDTTTNGSMNSRIEGYNDRVDLDFHTIARTLQESIHDLAYRETLINANKVIEHPKFRSSFRAAYGNEAYTSLRQWIGQLANSNNMDQAVGALGKFFQYTRTGIVINAIAFRATTVLKHGGSAGVKSVGYFAGGGEKFLASRAASMATDYSNQIASAKDKFGEIANRLAQQDRDWRATASTLFEPDKALEKAQRFGHAAVAWSDMMTAVPTAWAAYDRAVTEGIPVSQGGTGEPMTESQAVNYANKIVREAHGSTAEASRSMLLNNNSEAIKIFTTLFGFMNNTYGQGLDGFDKLRTAGISNTPVLARTIAAIIVPAIIAGAISHLPQHDEGWAAWAGKAIAEEVASTVPFVRDAVAMVQGFDHAGVVGPENWLATMVKAGVDLVKGTGKQVRDIADAVGMGLHIPGLGQIGMSAQYIHDVQVGKENPHDNLEYAKGVITGHGPPKK